MAKKDLKGGMANLLGGADQSVVQKPATTADNKVAAQQMKKEPTTVQDEADLLNSIEDAEFRKYLIERQAQKRLIGRGRPRKNDQQGRRTDGYERTSLIINKEKWAIIKEIALRETLTMKEIVELALDDVIERYEKKHGTVIPQEREKKDITEIF